MPDVSPRRTARLGADTIQFSGRRPEPGDRLSAVFAVPAARRADAPLTAAQLCDGLVVLSTLPNIQKYACVAQVADLDEHVQGTRPGLRVAHVSADPPEHWQEVDRFHPGVRAAGYSLAGADPASREAFVHAFGVGVAGHQRIAHGLFGLLDGTFLAVEIPGDQMRPARVTAFLARLLREVARHRG